MMTAQWIWKRLCSSSVYDGKDCNEVAKEIRTYAEVRCDMSMTMKPVADWLKNE